MAGRVDGPLSQSQLKADENSPSERPFVREFGSWTAAKEAASLDPNPEFERGPTYSDEELLEILREVAAEIDGSVSKSDVDERQRVPSSSTYQMRFGSWSKAKELAGVK